MQFAPLHNHTHYSALDGVSTPVEIAQRCIDIGCGAAGITDHGVVAGHLDFAKTMNMFGLNPILGMEAYHGLIPGKPPAKDKKAQRDQYHFIMLAGSNEGLRNLWRYADASAYNNHFVPRGTWDLYKKYSEGIWATSACISGVLPSAIREKADIEPGDVINKFLDIYGDRFYIEISTYPGEEHERLQWELINIAQERGIGLVYATDAHFAFPEQYDLHDVYIAMQTRENVLMPPEERGMWHPKSLYIQDEDQIRESLSYLPESVVDECLANSHYIAEQCDAHIPEVRPHIPSECPWLDDEEKKLEASEVFLDLIERGIHDRYGNSPPPEVWDQATFEAETFIDAGLDHYFLQAWDVTQYAKSENVPRGAGRGSAPGAITSYVLDLTDIDPLYYGLYFERFWNPGRAKGFPDIDFDYAREDRKKMHAYMYKRHGEEKVCIIGTVTRLKPKVAIERTANALCISHSEVEELKKIVSKVPNIDIIDADTIGWARETDPGELKDVKDGVGIFQEKEVYVLDEVGEEIVEWLDKKPESRRIVLEVWLEVIEDICSRVSGYGVHPSGVVVSDVSTADELPGMWNSKQEIKVTQFPMDAVDKRGFVKNDYLGLRNLDTLKEWEARMARKGKVYNWSGMEKEEYPLEMWQLLERGYTMGIFQIEDSYNGRRLAKEIKPRCVEDLAIIVALNRPGPSRSGASDAYLLRRNGEEDPVPDHPILEDITKETLGVIIYQEQIIAFCNALGYSVGESDAVRKMLGKKDPQAMHAFANGLYQWEGKGYLEMATKAGIPKKIAESLIEKIENFALYSFNKSHSLCYGTLAFRTLFAKYTGSAEFYIACIKTIGDDPESVKKTALFLGEARRQEIEILPPDILQSGIDIDIGDDGKCYFGFINIKGIGQTVANAIVEFRDRHGDRVCTPEGYADCIEADQALWEVHKEGRSPRNKINVAKDALLYNVGAFEAYEPSDVPIKKRQEWEQELLGLILTDHSREVFARNSKYLDACDDWEEFIVNEDIDKSSLPATIRGVRKTKVKKTGAEMAILTVEYQGWSIEVAVFSDKWPSYKMLLKELLTGIFTIKKNDRGYALEKVTILK